MIVRDMTTSPVEEERVIIDKQTAQSTYQTGYSSVTVKSVFNTRQSYADVLSRIIKHKMNIAGAM